ERGLDERRVGARRRHDDHGVDLRIGDRVHRVARRTFGPPDLPAPLGFRGVEVRDHDDPRGTDPGQRLEMGPSDPADPQEGDTDAARIPDLERAHRTSSLDAAGDTQLAAPAELPTPASSRATRSATRVADKPWRSSRKAFEADSPHVSAIPIRTSCRGDRKSTRLNSSHDQISYAV